MPLFHRGLTAGPVIANGYHIAESALFNHSHKCGCCSLFKGYSHFHNAVSQLTIYTFLSGSV